MTPSLRETLDRAIGLHQGGRVEDAADIYSGLVADAPACFDAHHLLGVARLQQGRCRDAAAHLLRALEIEPANPAALNHLGVTLERLGQTDAAMAAFDRALAVTPNHAAAINNRARLLLQLGRPSEAVAGFARALDLNPRYVDASFNLANALAALGEDGRALAAYERALALDPAHVGASINKSHLLRRLRRFEEALTCLDSAAAIHPADADILNNRAALLLDLHRPNEALAASEAALSVRADHPQALNNCGSALLEIARVPEALVRFNEAVACAPSNGEAHFNRGMTLALLGRLAEAWPEMEWRKQTPSKFGLKSLDRPEWTGAEGLKARTLFVHWEQGLGDTLQFCRFLPGIAAQGARIVFSAQRRLHALLRGLGGDIEIIGEDEIPAALDFHIPLLSLPLALGVSDATLWPHGPYLKADPGRIAHWKTRIGAAGFKVGLCWQGSEQGAAMGKSIPADALRILAAVPGVRMISLQAASEAPVEIEPLGPGFDQGPDGFLDTAAVMHALDLVVSVDTAVAHLAGALARPVWLLLRRPPDWRWRLEGSASPWYPTMTLFRQTRRGDWSDVLHSVGEALAHRPAR